MWDGCELRARKKLGEGHTTFVFQLEEVQKDNKN